MPKPISRYVGVVIEEDGRSEEEFLSEINRLNEEYVVSSKLSQQLHSVIQQNLAEMVGIDEEV